MKKISILLIVLLLFGCSSQQNDIESYEKWYNKIIMKKSQFIYVNPDMIKKDEIEFKKNLDEFKELIYESKNISMSDDVKKKHDNVIKELELEYNYYKILYKNRNFKNNKEITEFNKAIDKIREKALIDTIPKVMDEMTK